MICFPALSCAQRSRFTLHCWHTAAPPHSPDCWLFGCSRWAVSTCLSSWYLYINGILWCWVIVNMTCQARTHSSPGTQESMLFLKKGAKNKNKAPEICQLTGIPERTQKDWVDAAKASGDWNQISLKSAPRKRRSDSGVPRKLTRRMIATIKTRLAGWPHQVLTQNILFQ